MKFWKNIMFLLSYIKDPENPIYCAVDFGIMGSLSDNDKYYMAENFLAFFQSDYIRIAELHVESSWVSKKTNIRDFASVIRGVCEPIFQKPMNEISFGVVLLRLFQIARQFGSHLGFSVTLTLAYYLMTEIDSLAPKTYHLIPKSSFYIKY